MCLGLVQVPNELLNRHVPPDAEILDPAPGLVLRRTSLFRIHEPVVLPGIFQTEAYIRRMLPFWYAILDAPDDTDATAR